MHSGGSPARRTSCSGSRNRAGRAVASGGHGHSEDWSATALGIPTGASSAWLTAVSCTAVTNCTAVGYYTRAADSTTHPLAERLSGTTWTANTTIPEPAGSVRTVLNSVTCPTATTCIAVGGQQVSDATPFTSVVETSSGTTWELSLPPNAGELHGVSCGTATTCLAGGTAASDSLSGDTWNHPQIPNPDDGLSLFAYEVLAVSCTSATVCTAVETPTTRSTSSSIRSSWWQRCRRNMDDRHRRWLGHIGDAGCGLLCRRVTLGGRRIRPGRDLADPRPAVQRRRHPDIGRPGHRRDRRNPVGGLLHQPIEVRRSGSRHPRQRHPRTADLRPVLTGDQTKARYAEACRHSR